MKNKEAITEILKNLNSLPEVELAEIDHANERIKVYLTNEDEADGLIWGLNYGNLNTDDVLGKAYYGASKDYHYVYAEFN